MTATPSPPGPSAALGNYLTALGLAGLLLPAVGVASRWISYSLTGYVNPILSTARGLGELTVDGFFTALPTIGIGLSFLVLAGIVRTMPMAEALSSRIDATTTALEGMKLSLGEMRPEREALAQQGNVIVARLAAIDRGDPDDQYLIELMQLNEEVKRFNEAHDAFNKKLDRLDEARATVDNELIPARKQASAELQAATPWYVRGLAVPVPLQLVLLLLIAAPLVITALFLPVFPWMHLQILGGTAASLWIYRKTIRSKDVPTTSQLTLIFAAVLVVATVTSGLAAVTAPRLTLTLDPTSGLSGGGYATLGQSEHFLYVSPCNGERIVHGIALAAVRRMDSAPRPRGLIGSSLLDVLSGREWKVGLQPGC